MTSNRTEWLEDICRWFARQRSGSASIIVLPAYRPDVVVALTAALQLVYLDFRREKLAPLGWKAAETPLRALDECVLATMERGAGVVLHNAESLLSVHDAAQRRDWFDNLLDAEWPCPLVLPVFLFARDLPARPERIHRVAADSLPEQSLLMRLASV